MTWHIENGIGETRALLVENGKPLAAKLWWDGEVYCNQVTTAKLIAKQSRSRRGTAQIESGAEILVDKLPRELTEGKHFSVRISRAAIAERGRYKRAQGRYASESEIAHEQAHPFADLDAKHVSAFDSGLWEDVWSSASAGSLVFPGGGIVISATPAMTLIDVDCSWPEEAYHNAIPTIARALRWFDIGGNVGIDFPTIIDKQDRKAYDNRLAKRLADWPHESTAMNGFGFVQLVARLEGPSLLHRFASSRTGMCARYALRVGERAQGAGPTLLLTVHPALKSKLKAEWIDELAMRTGKQVRIETDPSLALEAPQAQIVAQ
ncbi:MAG: ribonuclease [Pseudomonadota bacterium]